MWLYHNIPKYDVQIVLLSGKKLLRPFPAGTNKSESKQEKT